MELKKLPSGHRKEALAVFRADFFNPAILHVPPKKSLDHIFLPFPGKV
jgi:hypothetical protein